MDSACVRLERVEPRLALVTINRPEKLNALSNAVMQRLDEVLAEIEADDATGGLVLTGAGERAFVAGADIAELSGATPLEGQARCLRDQRIMRRLERMRKPSLAAINGYALGGGLELAMCCTLRVAADNAKLGLPEARIGVFPANGGTQRLPRLIGQGRALEMMLTGEAIDAREAWRMGLVNHVVPLAALLTFSVELMGKILKNAPLSLATILECVHFEAGLEEGLRHEAAQYAALASSDDCKEGTRAFVEKRPARFQGK